MKRSKLLLAFLALSACGSPKLPEPRFELPTPPPELMTADPKLKTIDPNGTNLLNDSVTEKGVPHSN